MFLKMQKRSLAFLLALILLLSTFVSVAVVPASAAEADVADVSTAVSESYSMLDGKVSISSSTDNDACYSASSENGIFTATARCVVEENEQTGVDTLVNGLGTVTVTNTGSNNLSFVYRVSSQEGTVEMENDDITGSTDTVNLATGESVEFSVFSSVNQYTQNPEMAYATLSLSDFTEIQPADGVAYIEENPHARITANGEEVEDDSIEFYSSQGLELRAELDPGYGFLAWVNADTGAELSSVQNVILHPQGDLDIALLIYEKGTNENYGVKLPAFTNEAKFDTLAAAIAFESGTANKTITVLKDVDYTETNCVIPSGTTLLVPFDYARTIYRETPEVTPPSVKYVTPTAYREMTMKPGSSLTVANGGSICLSGKLSAVGQNLKSCCGTPTGPDGRIHMEGNSKINIQNGGKLYAWGYIYGTSGQVEAENGAIVYEPFQIKGWRGGTATYACYEAGVFPFNQYYVQNIEVELKLNSGAKEIVYSAVNAQGTAFPTSLTFIGADGMFQMEDGAYIIKDYDEQTDRLVMETHGNATLGAMTVTGLPLVGSLSTTQFDSLPLTNNITIDIKEGTINVEENIALLPGTELKVDEEATVVIEQGKNVYVMDESDWVNQGYAVSGADMVPIGYSVANGTTRVRTTEDLDDATVNINGTVEVYGGFLTKEEGSNVISTEHTGTIKYCSPVDVVDINCVSQTGTTTNSNQVQFVAANIKIDDETYIALGSDACGVYDFTNEGVELTTQMYLVRWHTYDYLELVVDEETGEEKYQIITDPDAIVLDSDVLYYAAYEEGQIPVYEGSMPPAPQGEGNQSYGPCIGWSTEQYATEPQVAYGEAFPAVGTEPVDYYAVHAIEEDSYFIRWVDCDDEQTLLLQEAVPTPYSELANAEYHGDPIEDTSITYSDKNFNYTFPEGSTVLDGLEGKGRRAARIFTGWDMDNRVLNEENHTCTIQATRTSGSGSASYQYLVLWVNEDMSERVSCGYYQTTDTVDPTVVPVPYKEGYVGHWKNLKTNSVDTPELAVNCVSTTTSGTKSVPQNIYVAVYEEADPAIEKHSLTLDGTIGVNFYADLSGFDPDDFTVDFSWGNKFVKSNPYTYSNSPYTEDDVTYTASRVVDGKTLYEFTAPVAAKNLNDEITAELKYNGEVVATESYRGTDYAYDLLGKTDEELDALSNNRGVALRALIISMLNYCTAAQNEFNYHTDTLANANLSEELKTIPEVPANMNIPNPAAFSNTGVSYYGSSVNLGFDTDYSVYLLKDQTGLNNPSLSYSLDNGATTNSFSDDNFASNDYAVRCTISGIPAAKTLEDIKLYVNGSPCTVNMKTYIKNALNSDNDTLKITASALYDYGTTAKAYFG